MGNLQQHARPVAGRLVGPCRSAMLELHENLLPMLDDCVVAASVDVDDGADAALDERTIDGEAEGDIRLRVRRRLAGGAERCFQILDAGAGRRGRTHDRGVFEERPEDKRADVLLDRVERSVVRGPFRPFPHSAGALTGRGRFSVLPKPPWFVTSRTGAAVSEGFTRFRMDGNWAKMSATLVKAFGA